MTIREKAEKEKLTVEQVVAVAVAAGINADNVDAKLSSPDAIKLGSAVKKSLGGVSASVSVEENNEVLFWSKHTKHTVVVPGVGPVKFDGHVLSLRKDIDPDLIKKIRKLSVVDIYEILNQPFDEDSNEYIRFSDMLDEIVFTGHSKERSKAGVKAVRAMFSPAELIAMGEHAFDPKRLVIKALHSKSCIQVTELKNQGE